jgi:hypothetical protein
MNAPRSAGAPSPEESEEDWEPQPSHQSLASISLHDCRHMFTSLLIPGSRDEIRLRMDAYLEHGARLTGAWAGA